MEGVNDSNQDAGLAASRRRAAGSDAASSSVPNYDAASQNGTGRGGAGAAGGVQSIERAFDLLEMLADAGGALGLSELSTVSGLPLPTVHRLMRTLVNRGLSGRRHPGGTRWARA